MKLKLIIILLVLINKTIENKINKIDMIRSSYEQTLVEKLFHNYNKRIKPFGVVQVKFSLTLNQIVNVIEKDQIVLINVFMDHEWIDNRILWNPNEFNNITLLRISSDQLWT